MLRRRILLHGTVFVLFWPDPLLYHSGTEGSDWWDTVFWWGWGELMCPGCISNHHGSSQRLPFWWTRCSHSASYIEKQQQEGVRGLCVEAAGIWMKSKAQAYPNTKESRVSRRAPEPANPYGQLDFVLSRLVTQWSRSTFSPLSFFYSCYCYCCG